MTTTVNRRGLGLSLGGQHAERLRALSGGANDKSINLEELWWGVPVAQYGEG